MPARKTSRTRKAPEAESPATPDEAAPVAAEVAEEPAPPAGAKKPAGTRRPRATGAAARTRTRKPAAPPADEPAAVEPEPLPAPEPAPGPPVEAEPAPARKRAPRRKAAAKPPAPEPAAPRPKRAPSPRARKAPERPSVPVTVPDLRPDRFLRACRLEPVDVTPVWLMRQAGRSLPAYRELRAKHGTIKQIAKHPELLAEITLLPLQVLEVDAAVMFADIMLPLAGLGVEFELVEDIGPVIFEPIRSAEQVDRLTAVPAAESVPKVLEAIRLARKELEGVVPLIGFSGAPFTLASYMIEGRPTRDFLLTKSFMYEQPSVWHLLMDRLAAMVVDYLSEQAAAGAQALQLFDSWLGALSPDDVEELVLPHTARIFEETAALGVPRIHFGTGTSGILELMAAPEPEVVGLDWRVPLDAAWARVGYERGVQGNLDPAVLLGPPELVRRRAEEVLRRAEGRPGHVFNLGHGVLPETPLDNLKLVVDVVHSWPLR